MGATLTRRQLLSGLGVAAGFAAASSALGIVDRLHRFDPGSGPRSEQEIDHFVLLMQENRSFDHYFGTRPGVNGYPDATREPAGARARPFPFLSNPELADLTTVDPAHDWFTQHASWNAGRMDGWVRAHTRADGASRAAATLGYYRRRDLPVHNALADAFTLCDGYFSSVMGPTGPNRLMWMSASIGTGAPAPGPLVGDLAGLTPGLLRWRTFPENLTAAGVSWRVYNALRPAARSELTSTLKYFAAYADPGTEPHARGLVPRWPSDFLHDVRRNRLPAVSWIIPAMAGSEHPAHPPPVGAETVMTVLRALLANPSVWERSALIVSYDENGGYFDHVAPPVAPAGTAGERVLGAPVGLGFRVPCLVISPLARGGVVDTNVYDHTSQLRLLSRRFGVPVPNDTAWRRATVGDLSAALSHPGAGPAAPRLPSWAATRAGAARAEAAARAERGERDA